MRGRGLSLCGALRAYGDNRNKSTSIGLSRVGRNPGQVVDGRSGVTNRSKPALSAGLLQRGSGFF
jgi:hypothetical protein